MNVFAPLEFELAYFDVAALHVSHYTAGTLRLFHITNNFSNFFLFCVISCFLFVLVYHVLLFSSVNLFLVLFVLYDFFHTVICFLDSKRIPVD